MSDDESSVYHDLDTVEGKLVNKAQMELYDDNENKDCLTRLRLLCLTRGTTGIIDLGRVFQRMDNDGSKTLNEVEFINGIREYGLEDISKDDLQKLFQSFDSNDNGFIDLNEFLYKLRPALCQNRLDVIEEAFTKMDKNDDGLITVDDLKDIYTVSEHPKYRSGEKSEGELLQEYLNNFKGDCDNDDDIITKEEFVNYYATISASIDNDEYFELMMRQAFAM